MKYFILTLLALSAVSTAPQRRRLTVSKNLRRSQNFLTGGSEFAKQINGPFLAQEKTFVKCLTEKGNAQFQKVAKDAAKNLMPQIAAAMMQKIAGGRRMSAWNDFKKGVKKGAKAVAKFAKTAAVAAKESACISLSKTAISYCVTFVKKELDGVECPKDDTEIAKICPNFKFVKECAAAQVEPACATIVEEFCKA